MTFLLIYRDNAEPKNPSIIGHFDELEDADRFAEALNKNEHLYSGKYEVLPVDGML